ncbi:MAG: hypothetical protein KC933_23755 [Myxococcales bacterium]|nr:hypothetical protein [Myxococcales bacterium]MCB9645740.1 hypothetical protein [Deltaproteobacteria bacterium]
MSTVLWALLLAAPPAVGDLWPCTPDLAITYRVERDGKDSGVRITETVKGQGAMGLCRVEQVTLHPGGKTETESFVYEHLPDRVAYAGYADAPTAFRPPLLKAPLEAGKQWTFHKVVYRVEAAGETIKTPAGTFPGCVRVSEAALAPGGRRAEATYAPGVGPVLRVTPGQRWVALEVRRPEAKASARTKR